MTSLPFASPSAYPEKTAPEHKLASGSASLAKQQ